MAHESMSPNASTWRPGNSGARGISRTSMIRSAFSSCRTFPTPDSAGTNPEWTAPRYQCCRLHPPCSRRSSRSSTPHSPQRMPAAMALTSQDAILGASNQERGLLGGSGRRSLSFARRVVYAASINGVPAFPPRTSRRGFLAIFSPWTRHGQPDVAFGQAYQGPSLQPAGHHTTTHSFRRSRSSSRFSWR
jgi:hypothetical protein